MFVRNFPIFPAVKEFWKSVKELLLWFWCCPILWHGVCFL